MYVESIPNRGSPPAILLRHAWREGKKIRKRTLANLSDWPAAQIEALRKVLRGETLVSPTDLFAVERSTPHGHVEAVLGTMRKLGLPALIASKPSRERELVLAMVAERLVRPCSKLATTRLWHATTLAEELGVGDAEVDDLYAALDWLLARQARIEAKLAARHLKDGAVVLYGLLTDEVGRPVTIEVYPGNTGDPTTVSEQIEKLRGRFGLARVVLVGDRGMLTQAQINKLKEHPGLGWISSLRSAAIRSLVDKGYLQRSLFDETNLAEIRSPD